MAYWIEGATYRSSRGRLFVVTFIDGYYCFQYHDNPGLWQKLAFQDGTYTSTLVSVPHVVEPGPRKLSDRISGE